MTQTEITNLLQAGALFRTADGTCFVVGGPLTEMPASNPSFGFARQEFFADDLRFFSAERHSSKVPVEELKSALTAYLIESKTQDLFKKSDFEEPTLVNFEKSYSLIRSEIHQGRLQKAVPVVFAKTERTVCRTQKASWLRRLLDLPPSLWVYGWWDENQGVLGASPEILFQQNGPLIQTMALAGTLPKSDVQNRPALTGDSKELFEHHLVIKDIETQLQKFGPVTKGQTGIVELPTLFHLRTEIKVHFNETPDLSMLVRELHPTSALGIFPRERNFRWLKELPEQTHRRHFGAPILFNLGENKSVAIVGIRNIEWYPEGAQIGSGCGIVSDSQLNQEWNELAHKRNAVMAALGIP